MAKKKVAVVAIGGNSLILDPKNVTVEDQYIAAARNLQTHRRYDRSWLGCRYWSWQWTAGWIYPSPF